MAEPIYDHPEDLKTIEALLLPGEAAEAVFDIGHEKHLRERLVSSALFVVTTRRVLLYVYREDIPRIMSISHRAILGIATAESALVIFTHQLGTHEFGDSMYDMYGTDLRKYSFRDAKRSRQAHDLILAHLL